MRFTPKLAAQVLPKPTALDLEALIQQLEELIIGIFTFVVPIKLPGDIQLTLWLCALIVTALVGGLAFLSR